MLEKGRGGLLASDVCFKSAHGIWGVSDNLFPEESLWAHLVTNVLLVSNRGVESPVQGSGGGLGSSQRPGPARWKQMPERDQKAVTQPWGRTPTTPRPRAKHTGSQDQQQGPNFPGQGRRLGLPDGSEVGIL